MSINKVMLLGRLGRDPGLRKTPNGHDVCSFSIATEERGIRKDGEKWKTVSWNSCVAWGGLGATIAEYFKKGDMIAVVGRTETSSYEKDGQKRYKTEVVVTEFSFVDNKKDNESGGKGGEELPF